MIPIKPGQKSARDYLAEHRRRTSEFDKTISILTALTTGENMTVNQFDQILGYLLKVTMPPSIGPDPAPDPSEILDVLLKYADEVRGVIIHRNIEGAIKCASDRE